jgi:hypothetical protein
MSETYRGVLLNSPGDAAPWGPIELSALKQIIDYALDTVPGLDEVTAENPTTLDVTEFGGVVLRDLTGASTRGVGVDSGGRIVLYESAVAMSHADLTGDNNSDPNYQHLTASEISDFEAVKVRVGGGQAISDVIDADSWVVFNGTLDEEDQGRNLGEWNNHKDILLYGRPVRFQGLGYGFGLLIVKPQASAKTALIYNDFEMDSEELAILPAPKDAVFQGVLNDLDPYPVSPAVNDFYVIAETGTVGGVGYTKFDTILWDGADWLLNERVTPVPNDFTFFVNRITNSATAPVITLGENVKLYYNEIADDVTFNLKTSAVAAQQDWLRTTGQGSHSIVNFAELDFYTANDLMAYTTQTASGSSLKKFVAMRGCKLTSVSWEMGSAPSTGGIHQARVNGGSWVNLHPSTTVALTGYNNLSSPIDISAGDTIEVRFTDSHSDSHTTSIELTY